MSHPPAKRHSGREKRMRERGYDTVSHPSATIYEKPHVGERMGLMAYGPDKEKTALHIACKAAFCLYFSFVWQGVRHCVVPLCHCIMKSPMRESAWGYSV